MPNTESEVIQTILKKGGKAKKGDVIKELGISLGYLDIITRSLERRGLVEFGNNVYSLTSLGKKKLAEFIPKTKKVKLEVKNKKGPPKKRGRPKKITETPAPEQNTVRGIVQKDGETQKEPEKTEIKTEDSRELPKEPLVETLLGQRVDELKEGMAEAEKKIEEGIKKIEKKIEKELEGKREIVEEKIGPIKEKIEELPPIILQFGKFLSSTGKKIFNRSKLKDFKVRNKLVSLPIWISKNYKNLVKKRS